MKGGFLGARLGFHFTVIVKGLGIELQKITSKWILEEKQVVDVSFLSLLVSPEENKTDSHLRPGVGRGWMGCRKTCRPWFKKGSSAACFSAYRQEVPDTFAAVTMIFGKILFLDVFTAFRECELLRLPHCSQFTGSQWKDHLGTRVGFYRLSMEAT